MDKDRAIITQVAAKLAAHLTNPNQPVDDRLSEWTVLFGSIDEILMDRIGAVGSAAAQNANVVEMVRQTFNATDASPPVVGAVQIAGKQHGPVPDWLIKACARDGVEKVWDNRDGLAVNPKRPWFKAVDGDKAYWPPKGK